MRHAIAGKYRLHLGYMFVAPDRRQVGANLPNYQARRTPCPAGNANPHIAVSTGSVDRPTAANGETASAMISLRWNPSAEYWRGSDRITSRAARRREGNRSPISCIPLLVPLVNDITYILKAIEQGETHAAEHLWALVYEELRQLAGAHMARERPGNTLDATALVHEAYIRLGVERGHTFATRRHFFAAAAEAMRRILVEAARRKGREKRGGGHRREYPDLDALHADGPPEEILALHDALEQFAVHDPLKAELVELRFFAGLTLGQAAECLNVSLSTADRAWRYARAWLYTAMGEGAEVMLDDKS